VIQARSYLGTERGALSVNADMLPEVADRDVLVIDDIFDTGLTLLEVLSFLDELGPRSVRTAVLVLKQGKQRVSLRPDYVGFEIPDVFVVGYGLDYNDAYRNLPYLAALEPQDIEAPRAL
jgi:hypoxanthine phosphoribosyltransferase